MAEDCNSKIKISDDSLNCSHTKQLLATNRFLKLDPDIDEEYKSYPNLTADSLSQLEFTNKAVSKNYKQILRKSQTLGDNQDASANSQHSSDTFVRWGNQKD